MRRVFSSLQIKLVVPSDTTAIGLGLAILTAAAICPGLPAVTGMALVALGATQAMLARFRGTAAIVPVAFLHLANYGGLYAIFVGATLHAAAGSVGAAHPFAAPFIGGHCSPHALALFDIALSVVPIGLALQRVWCQLHGRRLAE